MDFIVGWYDKDNSDIKHFIGVKDMSAKLVCDLLKREGYVYTCEEVMEKRHLPKAKKCDYCIELVCYHGKSPRLDMRCVPVHCMYNTLYLDKS